MSRELLREYIRDVVQELHLDPKMKAVLTGRVGQRLLQDMSRAKGLALRWSLERGVDLTPEIEEFAKAAFAGYLKRYGREVAPHALVQVLDRKYNQGHVGDKSDVPAGGRRGQGGGPQREDDPEAPGVVQSHRSV